MNVAVFPHSNAVFLFGAEPPPLSTEPNPKRVTSLMSRTVFHSGCIICANFSAGVICWTSACACSTHCALG